MSESTPEEIRFRDAVESEVNRRLAVEHAVIQAWMKFNLGQWTVPSLVDKPITDGTIVMSKEFEAKAREILSLPAPKAAGSGTGREAWSGELIPLGKKVPDCGSDTPIGVYKAGDGELVLVGRKISLHASPFASPSVAGDYIQMRDGCGTVRDVVLTPIWLIIRLKLRNFMERFRKHG